MVPQLHQGKWQNTQQDQTRHDSNQDLWLGRRRAQNNPNQQKVKQKWRNGMRKRKTYNPGDHYRKRLEPVFPGRLDLRSKRDAITGRRVKVKTESGRKKEKPENSWGLLTLSFFSCTTALLLLPRGPVPAGSTLWPQWRPCLQTQTGSVGLIAGNPASLL